MPPLSPTAPIWRGFEPLKAPATLEIFCGHLEIMSLPDKVRAKRE